MVGIIFLPSNTCIRESILLSNLSSALVSADKLWQNNIEPGRFNFTHPMILTDFNMHILLTLSMHSQSTYAVSNIWIIGDNHSAITNTAKILSRIKRVCTD